MRSPREWQLVPTLLLGVIVLIVSTAVGLWWWAGTEASLQWALQRAVSSQPVVVEEARALIAPQEALVGERDGTATVFVADQGKARAVKVRTGRRLDRDVEILEGLTSGQDIVTYGQQSLSDGQPVKTY